jgi:hypothetical protein
MPANTSQAEKLALFLDIESLGNFIGNLPDVRGTRTRQDSLYITATAAVIRHNHTPPESILLFGIIAK